MTSETPRSGGGSRLALGVGLGPLAVAAGMALTGGDPAATTILGLLAASAFAALPSLPGDLARGVGLQAAAGRRRTHDASTSP